MQKFKTVDELVNQLRPVKPVYCIRKESIQIASKIFQKKFPGKILYAVKTNPHPEVLKTIIQSGIENFDVASIEEIKDIVLSQLIQNWSITYEDFLKDFSADENIKIPSLSPKTTSTPLNFLKFWEKRFNKAGHDSLRKISRLYSTI